MSDKINIIFRMCTVRVFLKDKEVGPSHQADISPDGVVVTRIDGKKMKPEHEALIRAKVKELIQQYPILATWQDRK